MDRRIIQARLEGIRRLAVLGRIPIGRWRHRTADHLGPGSYRFDAEWVEHDAARGDGCSWPAGKTVFVAFELEAPRASGTVTRLQFRQERLEGLLRLDGSAFAGIDGNHLGVVLPERLEGRKLRAEVEYISELRVLCEPALADERGRLRAISLDQVDPETEDAYHDLLYASLAADAMEAGRRKELVGAALESALLAFDLTAETEAFRADLRRARAILTEALAQLRPDPEQGRVFLTGHSHIDTAWLWPLKETVRKCGRTFATAVRLMERFPSYRFSCSQPQLYAYTKEHYPELYSAIRRLVTDGRWETTGGMWVECDCNVPSGEALIRQFLKGIAFFRRELGTRPRSCWLPDVFGYPAGLPQVLKGCGIRWFYTNKLHWQARNKFPYNLFHWEGVDGSTVIAHVPRLEHYYNGSPTPAQLLYAVREFQQLAAYDELMLPFGYGDGGGGPTEEMLALADRSRSFPGLPSTRQGGGEQYFAAVEQARPRLPTWRGELYLETHRGTYTTQARTKRANRLCELALRDAEILGSLAHMSGAEVDLAPLDPAWEALLLHQFHDILPGSSIAEVYEEAERELSAAMRAARSVCASATKDLAKTVGAADVTVWNTLSWPRGGPVELEGSALALAGSEPAPTLVSSRGERCALQRVDGTRGEARYLLYASEIPSLGYETYRLEPRAAESSTRRAADDSDLSVSSRAMESRFFRLVLNDAGEITSLLDKRAGREVIASPETGNRFQLFQDGPEREAAWNVHASFDRREYPFEGESTLELRERGPLRGLLRLTRHHRGSRIEQDIVLWRDLPRIDFVTRVHWEERQVLLKVAFPVAVLSPEATYEVQFGAVQRPTHTNTSWDQEKFEVPAQRWADLSEAYYGVSLLNDSKYGYDVRGCTLRLTLLRGAEWPDPGADLGEHELTYSLYPHELDWRAARTVQHAAELNVPLLPVTGQGGGSAKVPSHSFLSTEGPAVIEALKRAEDGDGYILRLYEPCGGRGTVRVRSSLTLLSAEPVNLVEEPVSGEDGSPEITLDNSGRAFAFSIRPFGIVTVRLRAAG